MRYRERKRAKAEELKKEIGGLSTALTDMQIAKKENAALQDRSKFLEDALRRKEAEIARVKSQVRRLAHPLFLHLLPLKCHVLMETQSMTLCLIQIHLWRLSMRTDHCR